METSLGQMWKSGGLSILVPTYRHDVSTLVGDLVAQGRYLNLTFEVRIYDDGSAQGGKAPHAQANRKAFAAWPECCYVEREENIGAAPIRNLMGQEARYPWLIWLDSDSAVSPVFLETYAHQPAQQAVYIGGMSYSEEPPGPQYLLRWVYGRDREQIRAHIRQRKPWNGFLVNNVCLPRDLFLAHPLPQPDSYGHEDTLWGMQLKQAGVPVIHVENAAGHLLLETSERYLEKARGSVTSLIGFYKKGLPIEARLLTWALRLKSWGADKAYLAWANTQAKGWKKNLLSAQPKLRNLDFLKLKWALEELRG